MAQTYVFSSEEGERYVPKRIIDEAFAALEIKLEKYRTGKNTHMTKDQCRELARQLKEESYHLKWSNVPNLDLGSNERMIWTARKAREGEEPDITTSNHPRSVIDDLEDFLENVQCCAVLGGKD